MIRVIWQPCGAITLCNRGWPKFPKMPKTPGLYRIALNDGRHYIGEARNLSVRLYNYRRPTPGLEQEYRIYAALIEAGGGTIDIYTHDDLSVRSARCQLEKSEIMTALKAGLPLLNNEGPATKARLRAKIKYLEKELAAARALLDATAD